MASLTITSEDGSLAELSQLTPRWTIICLNGTHDSKSLFDFLDQQLRFPYFGYNWNALDECLSDLSWIDTEGICLVHEHNFTLNNNSDYAAYQRLIDYLIEWWAKDARHVFAVVVSKLFYQSNG